MHKRTDSILGLEIIYRTNNDDEEIDYFKRVMKELRYFSK